MAESPIEAKHESEVTPPAEEQTEFDDDTKRAIAVVYKTEGDDACERKDFSNAIQFYKDGINVNCNDDELNAELKKAMADAYKNEGNDAFKRKEYSKAIHVYTEGLQVNCKDDELNAKLYSNRATAHFNQGNYQDTIIDAKIAVDLQPTYIKAMEKGANACLQLRLYDEAIDWCDKGLKIDKENKTLVDLRSRSVDGQNKSQRQMAGGFPGDVRGGFPGDVRGGFPGGVRGGFPGGFSGDFTGTAGGFPGDLGGFPGGAGGFLSAGGAGGFSEEVTGGGETPILNDLLSDRELLAAFQDPAAMQAFQDVSQNPENLSKYGNNPNLKTIIDKLDEKFGPPGAGPPPGSGDGGLGGMSFGNMFDGIH